MNRVSRITLVGIILECITTLCNLQVILGDDLVQSVGASGEGFAGVAVAEDVAGGVFVEGGGPFGGAAVAGSVVRGHCCMRWGVWLLRWELVELVLGKGRRERDEREIRVCYYTRRREGKELFECLKLDVRANTGHVLEFVRPFLSLLLYLPLHS
jgi:hypothetical protein